MAEGSPNGVQVIGWHLAMAFGHGAGTMFATGEALHGLHSEYVASLERIAPDWDRFAHAAIAYGRVVGQLAAWHAASERRCVIDLDDVNYALQAARRNRLSPLGICHMTEPV